MIALSPEAVSQVESLEKFYIEAKRPEAIRHLAYALAEASLIILNAPDRGLRAPRPYPDLAALGLLWVRRGRYWIAYDPSGPTIAGVFFDTADIPRRIP